MPIAPLLVLIAIPEIADVIQIVGYAGLIGGTVGGWCGTHQSCRRELGNGQEGIVARDVLGLENVPKMNVERADVGPCNIPMYNFQICKDQLKAQKQRVTSSIPSKGVAQFDHIPPACMNLASVLGGSCTGTGARPVPCGSACMQYTGLSDKQMGALSLSLKG